MALDSKRYTRIHNKTGSALTKIQQVHDSGVMNIIMDHPEDDQVMTAVMHQMQKMQDELDYLRGVIDTSKGVTDKVNTRRQSYSLNFYDNIGTTKHYMPFKDVNEQTTIYQDEAAMVMPANGRVVSVSVRLPAIVNSGKLTVGVHTISPGSNQFGTAFWTEQEKEGMSFTGTDDYHLFHFVFDNAKHFDAGDLMSLSIQSSVAPSTSYIYFWCTAVIEYDYGTNIASSSREIES